MFFQNHFMLYLNGKVTNCRKSGSLCSRTSYRLSLGTSVTIVAIVGSLLQPFYLLHRKLQLRNTKQNYTQPVPAIMILTRCQHSSDKYHNRFISKLPFATNGLYSDGKYVVEDLLGQNFP